MSASGVKIGTITTITKTVIQTIPEAHTLGLAACTVVAASSAPRWAVALRTVTATTLRSATATATASAWPSPSNRSVTKEMLCVQRTLLSIEVLSKKAAEPSAKHHEM